MEPEVIIVKPGELFLKSKPVRRKLFKQLIKNIKQALKLNDVDFDYVFEEEARILVYTDEINEALTVIKNVFGITKLAPAVQVGSRLEIINEAALELAKLSKTKTFDVKTKRVYKKFPLTSVEISNEVRTYLADKTGARVNYKKPNVTVNIELLENKTFIYIDGILGLGGLPIPASGKVLCLCDSSFDSIIASWLFMRRGCEIVPLHLRVDEREHTQYLNHTKSLGTFSYGFRLKPYSEKLEEDMIEQAEAFAKEVGAKAIVLATQDPKKLPKLKKQTELTIFAPLIGLTTKELNSIKKNIQQA